MLGRRPLLDDGAALKDEHAIGLDGGGQAMGHRQHRAAAGEDRSAKSGAAVGPEVQPVLADGGT